MKKPLLVIGALGALTTAAQAQSSVTVYGVLDAGYIGSNAKEGFATNSRPDNKIQKSAFGQSAESTSRLGFKGTEDLGAGSSAFFTVEFGLAPQNSQLSGGPAEDRIQRTTDNSGSAIDNRQSFVGLKKNGVGQFAFGRQLTPVFNTSAATSPGQSNNIIGDVVYNGVSSVYGSGGTAVSGNNNSLTFTNRASNALTIQSDSFAGFQVGGMYAMNNQNQTQWGASGTTAASSGGNTNWGGWGLNGSFTWQKLYVGVAYQSFKTQYSTGVVGSAASAQILNVGSPAVTSGQLYRASQTVFPAAQISDKQTLAGATYDFGILKAYVQWVGRKVQNDYATTTTIADGTFAGIAGEQLNRTAQQIGARGYITPTIESWASIGNGKIKAAADVSSLNFVGWQLGSNYYLSKRTNLYAIYGQSNTSSATNSATARTVGSGSGANQYALGVRHTF